MVIDVPIGTPGELAIRGPNLMASYQGQEEDAAKSAQLEGFFKTGDAGYMDTNGYIYLTDRVKELIKVKGCANIMTDHEVVLKRANYNYTETKLPLRSWSRFFSVILWSLMLRFVGFTSRMRPQNIQWHISLQQNHLTNTRSLL